MKRLVVLACSICFFSYFFLSEVNAFSYDDTHLIIAFDIGVSEMEVEADLALFDLAVTKRLSRSQKIYLVKSYARALSPGVISRLSELRTVRYVQRDHLVSERAITPPNSRFQDQWGLFDSVGGFGIRAPEAWIYGVGGETASGDGIVVAIIDGGFDLKHPALSGNLWINSFELPGNGIDDDGNGYVDDVNGWNSYSKNGSIPVSDHGTHVMGIVGAEAPLSAGTVGVNWNVQLMAVAGSSGRTSVVIESYSYVLENKKIWIQTGGQEGANIVSTNSSFGIDFGDCSSGEYPVWNDIYNAMGAVGILSAAATINSSVDVDKDGDVPTQCDSPFIVSVTNTTKEGRKFGAAGFGANSIDVGAPGTDILSTVPRERFALMTGTSMATPHVAGAIGYLHSVASKEFSKYYNNNPGEAALELKKVLLETVDPRVDMEGLAVSGGQINLYRAAMTMNNWAG